MEGGGEEGSRGEGRRGRAWRGVRKRGEGEGGRSTEGCQEGAWRGEWLYSVVTHLDACHESIQWVFFVLILMGLPHPSWWATLLLVIEVPVRIHIRVRTQCPCLNELYPRMNGVINVYPLRMTRFLDPSLEAVQPPLDSVQHSNLPPQDGGIYPLGTTK